MRTKKEWEDWLANFALKMAEIELTREEGRTTKDVLNDAAQEIMNAIEKKNTFDMEKFANIVERNTTPDQ